MIQVDETTLEMKEVDDITLNVDEVNTLLQSTLNIDLNTFIATYNRFKEAEYEFKTLYEPIKERLLGLYATHKGELPNTIYVGGTVKLTYVSPTIKTAIDTKKLKEEYPEIAKKLKKDTPVSASIRLSSTTLKEGGNQND